MAINPADITTVQVNELPPNPLSATSIIAHGVGDILSRATIADLIAYLNAQSVSYQYEIKYIRPPGDGSAYIAEHFESTIGSNQGKGKVGGIWEGWQICNGNNGTDNLDGQVLMGYGANHGVIGAFLGEEEHVLTVAEMPSHNHKGNGFGGFGSGTNGLLDDNDYLWSQSADTSFTGGGGAHNNIQPSRVVLAIMKL